MLNPDPKTFAECPITDDFVSLNALHKNEYFNSHLQLRSQWTIQPPCTTSLPGSSFL